MLAIYCFACHGRSKAPTSLWTGSTLTEGEREAIESIVDLLEIHGPDLRHPYSSGIEGSQLSHLRELRKQHAGDPYRVLYAFNPLRTAILLLGGNKGGDDRWYEVNVPKAEALYAEHLEELRKEGTL